MSDSIHKSHNVRVPIYSVTKVVRMVKNLTAREMFRRCPQVKKRLWGGESWKDGFFASMVGKHGDEAMIGKYVKNFLSVLQIPHLNRGNWGYCRDGHRNAH